MMTDEEEFYAWLDGELDAEGMARVEARMAADPALQRLAEQHRAMAASLRGAFEPVMTPAPERIGGEVVGFAPPPRPAANENRPGRMPAWASLAATLAIGLVAGTLVPRGGSDPVAVAEGRMIAAGALDGALDTQLASAEAGAVRIGLTFRDAKGQWCRSFDGAAGAGLACREGGDWAVRALYPAQGQGGDYRMATGLDPRLAELVGEAMAGEAVDAEAERAARDGGWR